MRRRETPRIALDPWARRRARLRLECRECEVVCQRVVSPWHCLKSACRYVYVYHDSETAYFGCLHKVFAPDLDMAAFETAESKSRRTDPYGSLVANRLPRHECHITIEQAYGVCSRRVTCCNPTFFLDPRPRGEQGIRLTVNRLDDPESDRRT